MKRLYSAILALLLIQPLAAQPPDIEEIEGVVQNLTAYSVTTDDGDMIIETDVYIRVTKRVRGASDTFITLRVHGGTLNGVTVVNSNETVPTKNKKYHVVFNTDSHSKKRPVDGNNGMRIVQ